MLIQAKWNFMKSFIFIKVCLVEKIFISLGRYVLYICGNTHLCWLVKEVGFHKNFDRDV